MLTGTSNITASKNIHSSPTLHKTLIFSLYNQSDNFSVRCIVMEEKNQNLEFSAQLRRWRSLWRAEASWVNDKDFAEKVLNLNSDSISEEFIISLIEGHILAGKNLSLYIAEAAGHIPKEVAKSKAEFIATAESDRKKFFQLDILEKENGGYVRLTHEEIIRRESEQKETEKLALEKINREIKEKEEQAKKQRQERQKSIEEERKKTKTKASVQKRDIRKKKIVLKSNEEKAEKQKITNPKLREKTWHKEHAVLGILDEKSENDISLKEMLNQVGISIKNLMPIYRALEKMKIADLKKGDATNGYYEINLGEIDGLNLTRINKNLKDINIKIRKSDAKIVRNLYSPVFCLTDNTVTTLREALLPPIKNPEDKNSEEMAELLGIGIIRVKDAYKKIREAFDNAVKDDKKTFKVNSARFSSNTVGYRLLKAGSSGREISFTVDKKSMHQIEKVEHIEPKKSGNFVTVSNAATLLVRPANYGHTLNVDRIGEHTIRNLLNEIKNSYLAVYKQAEEINNKVPELINVKGHKVPTKYFSMFSEGANHAVLFHVEINPETAKDIAVILRRMIKKELSNRVANWRKNFLGENPENKKQDSLER